MRRFLLPWAAAALLLLGDLVTPGELEPEEAAQLQFINFNFDTVRVTWNASKHPGTNWTLWYTFGSDVFRQCPNYILDRGVTAGCDLEVEPDEDGERDVVLEVNVYKETHVFLEQSVWISSYLKPNPTKDLKFLWKEETVTIMCSDLPYKGVIYEIQYKSNFDSEWQSTEEETCTVTVESLDAEKCYHFHSRVKAKASRYGPETYPSDWSEVTHWQGGQQKDACHQEEASFPKSALICSLVTLLILCVLFVSVCKLQRVEKLLMPSVPDPKATFPGLFEDHRGNFQEWIRDTQNVTHVTKLESEEDCDVEEMLVAHLVKAETEAPTTRLLCPQMGVEEATGPGQHPCQPPQCGDMVSLGGFSFVMNDNMYVTL